jgi:hypothetical protein
MANTWNLATGVSAFPSPISSQLANPTRLDGSKI